MTEVFNRQDCLERVGGDEELLEEMVQMFMEYTPGQLQRMRQAWEAGDVARMLGEAHSLKGAASTISAEALKKVALDLELSGKNCPPEQAAVFLNAIIREFDRLQQFLGENGSEGNG
jgi:HPt (histidine-containing phosphotransfer) domain-containing protein